MQSLTVDQVDELWRLWGEGYSYRRLGHELGVPPHRVKAYQVACGGVRPKVPARSKRHLTFQDREEISRGIAAGHSLSSIAKTLGRPPSTICREVNRNGGRDKYRAHEADQRAEVTAKRPKVCKLARDPLLRAEVELRLEADWSPRQISASLRTDFPGEPSMRISHESVYLCVYQPQRDGITPGMRKHLRTAR